MSRRGSGQPGRPSSGRSDGRPATPSGAGPLPGAGDPLAGVERVFIDGNNLLYALSRGSRGQSAGGSPDGGPPMPTGAVIGRLRAAFPASVIVDLVFDGRPTGGVTGRLATGLRVSYSGRETADRIIDEGVAAQLAADGPAATWGILVVSDDRGLRDAVGAKGARTAGTAWLAGRIGHAVVSRPNAAGASRPRRGQGGPASPLPKAGTTFGHRRPPRPPSPRD